MKRFALALLIAVCAATYAQRDGIQAQGGPGRGLSPEQQAALAAQAELEKNTPQIPYDAVSLPLMPDGHTIGETEGVAINSKKHLFVYTRSGNVGPARGSQAAELFEFDETGQVREGVGPERLRLLVRPRRPSRQGRQRVGGRRRLEHGDEVQPAGPRHDGARPQGRSDRLPGALPRRRRARPTRRDADGARRRRRPRRHVRPADRRRVRSAGQHLRLRRLRPTRASRSSPKTATS